MLCTLSIWTKTTLHIVYAILVHRHIIVILEIEMNLFFRQFECEFVNFTTNSVVLAVLSEVYLCCDSWRNLTNGIHPEIASNAHGAHFVSVQTTSNYNWIIVSSEYGLALKTWCQISTTISNDKCSTNSHWFWELTVKSLPDIRFQAQILFKALCERS